MVMIPKRVQRSYARGEALEIDDVTYFAAETLMPGQYVEVGADGLVRPCEMVDVTPTDAEIAESLTDDPFVAAMMFPARYIEETKKILSVLELTDIDTMANHLALAKTIYVVGLGGSAATASHAANDLRKLCGKNAICPTDNTSLMTALANDYSFDEWLLMFFGLVETFDDDTAVLFLSVGGGNGKTSRSLVLAAEMLSATQKEGTNVPILAIVGRDGGDLAKLANCAVVIPNMFPERVTPHVEGLSSVLLHLLVAHPALAKHAPTWRT